MNVGEEEGGGGGGGGEEMEEDGKEEMMVVEETMEEKGRDKTVLMWGYLPGVSPQRSPLLHPVAVRMPDSPAGDRWRDVSGGGCGFAMAISGIDLCLYSLSASSVSFLVPFVSQTKSLIFRCLFVEICRAFNFAALIFFKRDIFFFLCL